MLPHVQRDIYLLLHDLAKDVELDLVVDEGHTYKEISVNHHQLQLSKKEVYLYQELLKIPEFCLEFFRGHQEFSAATILECFHPKLFITHGVDDGKEISQLKDIIEVTPDVNKFLDLNESRSSIYLQQSLKLAKNFNTRSVAIVIGHSHLPQMIEEYEHLVKQRRVNKRLIVIEPKALHDNYGETNPLFYMETMQMASKLQKSGHLEDALRAYSKAIRLDPNHEDAYLNRGMIYEAP